MFQMTLQDISFSSVLAAVCVILLTVAVCSAGETQNNEQAVPLAASPTPSPSFAAPNTHTGPTFNSSANSTDSGVGAWHKIVENKGMLLRSLYVLIGVTILIVLYFVIKTVRLRHLRSKSKKYGVLATADDNLELHRLEDDDDDDEDMTVFEVNGKRK